MAQPFRPLPHADLFAFFNLDSNLDGNAPPSSSPPKTALCEPAAPFPRRVMQTAGNIGNVAHPHVVTHTGQSPPRLAQSGTTADENTASNSTTMRTNVDTSASTSTPLSRAHSRSVGGPSPSQRERSGASSAPVTAYDDDTVAVLTLPPPPPRSPSPPLSEPMETSLEVAALARETAALRTQLASAEATSRARRAARSSLPPSAVLTTSSPHSVGVASPTLYNGATPAIASPATPVTPAGESALVLWRLGRAAHNESAGSATPKLSPLAGLPCTPGPPAQISPAHVGARAPAPTLTYDTQPHGPAHSLASPAPTAVGAGSTTTPPTTTPTTVGLPSGLLSTAASGSGADGARLPLGSPPSPLPAPSSSSLALGEAVALCRRWRNAGRLLTAAVDAVAYHVVRQDALTAVVRGNVVAAILDAYAHAAAAAAADTPETDTATVASLANGSKDYNSVPSAIASANDAVTGAPSVAKSSSTSDGTPMVQEPQSQPSLLLSLTRLLVVLAASWQCRATVEQGLSWTACAAALRESPRTCVIRETALLVTRLARGSQDARLAMVAAGVPDVLLARSKYARHPATLARICDALLALASNVEGRQRIMVNGGVRVIVHHAQHPGALADLDDCPEATAVAEHCICLLSTLTWNDDSVISYLVACGGLELLVTRLRAAPMLSSATQRQLASMTAHVALSAPVHCAQLVQLGALLGVATALPDATDAHTRDAMLHCFSVLISGMPLGEADTLPLYMDDCEACLIEACACASTTTAFSRLLPALQAIAKRPQLAKQYACDGVFDALATHLTNPDSVTMTMEVCEVLRALLGGALRPSVVRTTAALLSRTESRREAAATATLLWSIAYNAPSSEPLLPLGVLEALLTSLRRQEQDGAPLRAILGAVDAMMRSEKAAAIFVKLRGVHELVRAARMAEALEAGTAREELQEVCLHAMVNLMVSMSSAAPIVAADGVSLFLTHVSNAAAALCNPRLTAVCIAGLRCLSGHPRPLRALQTADAALQLLALVRQTSDLAMATDLLAVLRRVTEGNDAADALIANGGIRQLLAFKSRAATGSANEAHRLHTLCQDIIVRLQRDASADISIVTEV